MPLLLTPALLPSYWVCAQHERRRRHHGRVSNTFSRLPRRLSCPAWLRHSAHSAVPPPQVPTASLATGRAATSHCTAAVVSTGRGMARRAAPHVRNHPTLSGNPGVPCRQRIRTMPSTPEGTPEASHRADYPHCKKLWATAWATEAKVRGEQTSWATFSNTSSRQRRPARPSQRALRWSGYSLSLGRCLRNIDSETVASQSK